MFVIHWSVYWLLHSSVVWHHKQIAIGDSICPSMSHSYLITEEKCFNEKVPNGVKINKKYAALSCEHSFILGLF